MTTDPETSDLYTKFCRPGLGKLLKAFSLDIKYTRAKEDKLWYVDDNGREREVLDLVGSYGATLLGHNPRVLTDRLCELSKLELPHLVQASARSGAAELAQKLNKVAKNNLAGDYVSTFFSTGTEAVEAAIKHLVLVQQNKHKRLKEEILVSSAAVLRREAVNLKKVPVEKGLKLKLPANRDVAGLLQTVEDYNLKLLEQPFPLLAFNNSFHGKTLGSLSLTNNERYRSPFASRLSPVIFIDHEISSVKRVLADAEIKFAEIRFEKGQPRVVSRRVSSMMGIFLEPVLGEGGAIPLPVVLVEGLFRLAQEAEIPLVVDEIQSGMGRCGTFFALEKYRVPAPEMVLLSKFLGGGLVKLSGLLTKREICEDEFGIIHTSTFAEDEISCRIGSKVIDILLDENGKILQKCKTLGERIITRLSRLQSRFPEIIQDVRGAGLLIGIEFKDLRNSGSNFLRFICTQGDFGYFISGFLLHEFDIRVAPGLNAKRVIRIEPSVNLREADIENIYDALKKLCEILQKRDTYLLSRFLLPEFRKQALGLENVSECIRNPDDFMQPDPVKERVAFLGHFISPEYLARHEPPFRRFSDTQLDHLIEKTWEYIDPCLFVSRDIKSATGRKVNFSFIGMSVTSQILSDLLRHRDLKTIRDQIRSSLITARDFGCSLAGFGQFTSILTRNCLAMVVPGINFTSGNTLTVGMAMTALEESFRKRGWNWKDISCAVLGGGGNIGSTFARLVADKAKKLVLVGGRSGDSLSRLEKTTFRIFQDQMEEGKDALNLGPIGARIRSLFSPTKWGALKNAAESEEDLGGKLIESFGNFASDDRAVSIGNLDDVSKCGVVITATNTAQPFILPHHLKDEAMVCDISIPTALTPDAARKPGIEAFKGGVVALPNREKLNIGALPLDPGQVYACMAETILLGLERRWEDFSVGDIHKNKVIEILEIAKKHGFSLARLKCEDAM